MFDFKAFEKHIQAALDQYEKTAPPLARYLDDLYVRVSGNAPDVRLIELRFAGSLLEEGTWLHPNTAQNRLFHLLHGIGRDTTGMADF